MASTTTPPTPPEQKPDERPADTAGWSEVIRVWFGELDADGLADGPHRQRWFVKDPAWDAELTRRFADTHAAIAAGQREDWLRTPRGRLAQVVVLDQFSRNMFRDTPGMYATDALALRIAAAGIEAGEDARLETAERVFLYMPFMHSEDVVDQRRCVALFEALRDAASGAAREQLGQNVRFAEMHRDIVERFGRFPHRNAILGRASTEEELGFLLEAGSSF